MRRSSFQRGMREVHGDVEFVEVRTEPTRPPTALDQVRRGTLTFGVIVTTLVFGAIILTVIVGSTAAVFGLAYAFLGMAGGVVIGAMWAVTCLTVVAAGLGARLRT